MLGLFEDAVYQTTRVVIPAGGTLVFYSDGVTEAESPGGEFFQESGLEAVVERNCDLPAGEIASKIVGALDAFAAGREQSDDITVLVVRFRP